MVMNVSIISDNSVQAANSTVETALTGCHNPSRIFLPLKTSIMKLRIFALLFIALPMASQAPEPETKPADPGLKSFAKYDFVPGEVVRK